jgi:alpha-1,3-mannosyltransferase
MERIAFLAAVRNRAAELLWPVGQREEPEAMRLHASLKVPDEGYPADYLVFINDVFFCAADVLRLMQHDADMVCGVDFDGPPGELAPPIDSTQVDWPAQVLM